MIRLLITLATAGLVVWAADEVIDAGGWPDSWTPAVARARGRIADVVRDATGDAANPQSRAELPDVPAGEPRKVEQPEPFADLVDVPDVSPSAEKTPKGVYRPLEPEQAWEPNEALASRDSVDASRILTRLDRVMGLAAGRRP